MLSDEEKKAIEKIKSFNQYNWEMNNLKGKEFAKPYFESLDTLLNLVEKQSKEIEELKEKNKEDIKFKRILTDNFKRHIESITIGESITFPCGWVYKKDLLDLINDIKWEE